MPDAQPSILDLIEMRRWKRALFTSFTLSLTFFECYVLPRLRAQGCKKIDIYVDALGYRDSLVEQRSRHAGRDYSIHPVLVDAGIFHPKLVYLWADSGEDDFLLVGSGNLTHSGHGGSLEVFEALRANLHALAFGQAADFFAVLAQRQYQTFGSSEKPLAGVQRRMTALAKKFPNVQDVQFIHSLSEPALFQMIRYLDGRDVEEMLVMSPYHNPEAEPIKKLVDATRPARLLVSLDGMSKTSPFPFEKTSTWGCEVRAVVALDEAQRFAHAKWYEWRMRDHAVCLTGSFNATTESFATCRNVECGVIRRLDAPSDMWTESEPRPFKKQVFPRTRSDGQMLAAATLTGTELKGQVFGFSFEGASDWIFILQNGDLAPTTPQALQVDAEGKFSAEVAHRIDVALESAMQIHMESGALSARGWVALPNILNIAPEQRSLLSMLSEIERGSESATGFTSLLYIVMDEIKGLSARAVPRDAGQPGNKGKPAGADEHDWTASPRENITDDPAALNKSPHDRLLSVLASGQRGGAMWGALGEVLLGSGTTSTKGDMDGPLSGGNQPRPRLLRFVPETEDESSQAEAEAETLRCALREFDTLVAQSRASLLKLLRLERVKCEESTSTLLDLAQLERFWLHVTLRALVGPLNDTPMAIFQLGEWMHKTVDLPFNDAALASLLTDFAGCAAVLASQLTAKTDDFQAAIAIGRHPSRPARTVHYLEAACNGAPDIEKTLLRATGWLDSQIGNELVDGAVDGALAALALALRKPTPRSRVAQFLLERPSATMPSAWLPLPEKSVQLLRSAIRVVVKGKPYGEVDVKALMRCPMCHNSLCKTEASGDERRPDPTLLAELKLFNVAACIACHKPLITASALPPNS